MNENWTDDLRQQMEQYESTDVPEGLWEGIEHELDGCPRAVIVPAWRRWAVACVAVAVVGLAWVLYSPLPTSPGGGEQRALCKSNSKKMVAVAKVERRLPKPNITANMVPTDDEDDVVIAEEECVVDKQEVVAEEYSADAATETKPVSPPTYYRDEVVPLVNKVQKSGRRGSFRVELYASQMPQNQHNGMDGYLALSKQGAPSNTPVLMAKGNMGNMDYLALTNDGKNPVTDVRHNQPVRIGFSIGCDVTRRWGISIGASYTKLKSTLTAGTETSYYTNDQTINYIGFPVNLSYTLLRTWHLRFYATAGGMAEFGVGGETVVETVTKGQTMATEKHRMEDIPKQFSANAGGGVELKVYRSIGIFAEAGVSYYFDNNSEIATIYSTHPLNLNLQFGIRWTLISR